MKKLVYLWVVSMAMILTSCNLSKDITFQKSDKLQAKQELIKQNEVQAPAHLNAPIQDVAKGSIKTCVSDKTSTDSIGQNEVSINPPFYNTKLIKKTGQAFTLPKIRNSVNNLLKKQMYSTQIGRAHLSDDDYKRLWIMFLAIAIICFILAFIFYLLFLSLIEDIFDLLGILASIPGLLFLILWLVDIM